jgi:magnesium-transporting ATPase (P-type)
MEIITGCVETYRMKYPKVFYLPHDSKKKFSISLNKHIGGHWLSIKGAPELILRKCSTILTLGGELKLNDGIRKKIFDAYEELGCLGERVIGYKSFLFIAENVN